MKKKIKTWLIHLLGGVTRKEIHQSNINSACFGAYQALTIIKEYADSLNGKPADEDETIEETKNNLEGWLELNTGTEKTVLGYPDWVSASVK